MHGTEWHGNAGREVEWLLGIEYRAWVNGPHCISDAYITVELRIEFLSFNRTYGILIAVFEHGKGLALGG